MRRRDALAFAITLFSTIALLGALFGALLSGCLIDRGDLAGSPARDASADAPVDDSGLLCAVEEVVCGARCVNTATDPLHCGRCGEACDSGQTCSDGRCVGCPGTSVHGVCTTTLRLWLDARDPNGDGLGGTPGPLTRWANLARTTTGDAMASLGSPVLEDGIAGQRVVRLEGSALRTSGVLSEAGTHAEIFLVARVRALSPGFTLAMPSSTTDGVAVQLPGDTGSVFGVPSGERAMTAPFGRDVRHTTLWHAFGGPSGREVRIDGTLVARGEDGVATPLAAPLLIGASEDGRAQAIDISELLVFDQPLSSADRAAITAALLERWGLRSPEAPPPTDLSLWLDARAPLRDSDVTDGAALSRWDDRSTRASMATAVGATYRADGFGGGRPAIEITRDAGPSYVSFARPVAGDLTVLLAFSTDDGAGEGEGWSSANVIGADARLAADDGAVVLASGRVGFGRETTMMPSSRGRIDDGDLHVVVVRRTGVDGNVRIWVDHEQVVNGATLVGAVAAPAEWFLGRHPDDGEGALAARYGEVLVYARALADEEINVAERYLVRRWSSPPAARQPRLTACAPGTHLACPAGSLAELRGAASGTYWLDLGGGPHRVSIDAAEGGGWALVLQYVHAPGTSPELDVIQPGEDWPSLSPTALGGGDVIRSPRWGHVGAAVAATVTSATEIRFGGTTSGHERVIHFSSTVGVDGWRGGRNTFAGIERSFTPLTGHTGQLPASALSFPATLPDGVLTDFPFYGATADWCVRGSGIRWEVDDLPVHERNATIHRVWVR